MDRKTDNGLSHAILDLEGATCGSCVYTIEHVGRKIDGIRDVYVDVPHQKIHVEYKGNRGSLESIVSVIERLGYSARIPENIG